MQHSLKRTFAAATASLVLAIVASPAQAHFIWLTPTTENDETTVQVYFGEDASPDDPDLLKRVAKMKVLQVAGRGEPKELKLELTEESLSAKANKSRSGSLFIAAHDLGVFDRGDSVFRLRYFAKGGPAVTNAVWKRIDCSKHLVLDVVPAYDNGELTVTVSFKGEPVTGAQVKASGPGLDGFEGETDEKGKVTFAMKDAGLYSIRARHIAEEAGEIDGKKFPETRYYSTVAVDVPTPLKDVPGQVVAEMEEPVTSFGAAVNGKQLFVYGGHTGGAHSYSNEEQGHQLLSLNLETKKWEALVDGPPLQGLAMVAHGGKLYRLGGFTAKNEEGEDHDLWSQAEAAVYDPAAKAWTALPPLPEPRSSFDAAVLDDAIYVIGGWSMQGEEGHHWHTTAWKLDLKQATPSWSPVPEPPFQRRALATAAYEGKLYAIGGMQEEGGPTRRVDVFDPKTGKWTQGPDILGDGGMAGFGASAFATGGDLYVSTIKGTLQRLSKDGSKWEMVGKTPTARFFHRMLPLDASHLVMVGGANMGIGKFSEVEILSVE